MQNVDDFIILTNVHKSYKSGDGKVQALKDVSLSIKKGEFVAIVGPSGSGKTTLMNTIGCLDSITSGKVFFYGVELSSLNKNSIAELRNRYIGFVFQRYNLLSYLTAKENVSLPAQYTKNHYASREERALQVLRTVGLADRVNFRPNQLSGGEQQRVSIARALMNEAEVILADEPTGALDGTTGNQVMDLFRELNDKGKTIILVTHDKEVAAQANRIISMNDGQIVSDENSLSPGSFIKGSNRRFEKNTFRFLSAFSEAFRTAFRALSGNKVRSFLSMLGVIIGVFAVMMSVAISEGAHQRIMSEMKLLDTRTIEIRPGSGWKSSPEPGTAPLAKEDIDTLRAVLPKSHISPVMTSSSSVNATDGDIAITLNGVSRDYLEKKTILAGRLFDTQNIADSDAVIVIDSRLSDTLYVSPQDAIGKYINVSGYLFEIIGVIDEAATTSRISSLDVWIPWTSYTNRISGSVPYEAIQVRTDTQHEMEAAREKINHALKNAHGKMDFFTVTNESIAEMIANVSNSMKLLTITISAISLLVGGVGVMNIMFVSVTERIHEIGIRLSVGARPADIKRQFIIEAVFICLSGGILGIILTGCASVIVPYISNELTMVLTLFPVLIAFTFSFFIGIVFGYLPAKQASSYTPAKALGYR